MADAWDVIVVGGGPAGSACASFLAEQGRRVLVLDAARFPRRKACAEYISPGAADILERLGALERLESARTGRWIRGMQLEAPGGEQALVAYQDEKGAARMGLSAPRLVLDAVLLELARTRGAEVREGYRVHDLWHDAGRVRGIVGPSGERLSAELVVGADGTNSIVARRLGLRRRARWPQRLGLVAQWQGVHWPEDYGRLLVGQHGYVGVAPQDDHGHVTVGLVRSMPRGRLGSASAALDAALAEYPAIRDRLCSGQLAGDVLGGGPLARRVQRPAGPGYALVGDAAGFFDPFTGEGIFRALRSAELLAACPGSYAGERKKVFSAKQRLVALIQVFVQTPRLMDYAVRRLQTRPAVARDLGNVLGDLQPAHLGLAWRLLGP